MKELIDPASAERVLLLAGVLGPVVGIIVGGVAGLRARRLTVGLIAGVLIGAMGTLIYAMWRVYGVITGVFGLDSTANLALQILIFAVLGAGLGVVIVRVKRLFRRLGAECAPRKPSGSTTGGA